ncbi:MAG: threonine--tRNA ligase [Candidatus Delongbacteria bacterium]|nr:threonine--tRNA ligase [Candidatus Delongbacteria bacterium]
MIKVTFPDGSSKSYAQGITALAVAEEISSRLAKKALGARIDQTTILDLMTPLTRDCSLEILTFDDPDGKKIYWHSTSHVMAQAVQELFPGTRLAIGPSIDEGFYYDFDKAAPFTPEDLEKIEARMAEIITRNEPFRRQELSREEAIAFFNDRQENYKLELIRDLPTNESISCYHHSTFTDLCRGPHLPTTGLIKSFKLLSIAGAYWRGDEKNPMLQRIYGISFPDKKMLAEYLERLEEAKRRDHRRLGKELELFDIAPEIGPGLVLWHPKGAVIRNEIETFWKKEHHRFGYQLVNTPHIARLDLWHTSGHTGFYNDNMFSPMIVEEIPYQLKPMNCPFHIFIYNNKLRSYRDLPIRYAELGTVYRFERSGVLHGLMRVRGFTQDDAHIYCRPDQLKTEIERVIQFTLHILNSFGFTQFDIYLSTQPEHFVGSQENWDRATEALRSALEATQLPYTVDPGEGVFYGPKIDIKIKDILNRSWQCSTIQVDFNLPERFAITYKGADGQEHQPIMIHRALMGSLERFFGVLIEHYGGDFPLWLAPVQAVIIPVSEKFLDYARTVQEQFNQAEIRINVDDRNEKLGYKIREAESQKIPYMFIVGEKEEQSGGISVRQRKVGDRGTIGVADLLEEMTHKIKQKQI